MTLATKANILHGVYALLIQIPLCMFIGHWWTVGMILVAFFIGREHAQNEYFITKGGEVGNLPPWTGFIGWNSSNYFGVISPMVAVYSAAFLATYV
jgi:hypothetical protein